MQAPQEAGPRSPSPFAAAFLSLLFPGLGHLYAGAKGRALGFAAAPILLVALVAGFVLRMDRVALVGLIVNPTLLTSVFVINLILLVYRVIAIIDAYRVAEFVGRHAAADPHLGPARLIRHPVSIAGLVAVLLVMSGAHVVVARYDMLALDALTSGCIFISNDQPCQTSPDASDSPSDSGSASDSGGAMDTPSATPSIVGTPVPDVSIPPWNGKDRLNILLLGADVQGGGHNTDTMIVVSIDPVAKQVAMFSLPRDMTGLPVPPGPARALWGSTYDQKINSFFINNRNRSDIWPGTNATRGYNAVKAELGYVYGLNINYFVEVDFSGFTKVIDALGGVTVNVQIPIADDRFPSPDGRMMRLYIPSGLQHMDGTQALQYARSRHSTSDFDRASRQQRILLSLREQANPQQLIPELPDLVAALKASVKTDIPVDQLPSLLSLASSIDTSNISSYVFQPPLYGSETGPGAPIYHMFPNVPAIRAAVQSAFKTSPADEAQREKLAAEGAAVWIVSGLNDRSIPTDLAGYLEYRGIAASAPLTRPTGPIPAHTQITVYNGAESSMADTIAYLQTLFGVTAVTVTDPAVRADIVVTVGRDTPDLTAPPLD